MPVSVLKSGGVRRGGPEDQPTWHSLVTLKPLNEEAQVQLSNSLQQRVQCPGEELDAFKLRVVARWRGDTLEMLLMA